MVEGKQKVVPVLSKLSRKIFRGTFPQGWSIYQFYSNVAVLSHLVESNTRFIERNQIPKLIFFGRITINISATIFTSSNTRCTTAVMASSNSSPPPSAPTTSHDSIEIISKPGGKSVLWDYF